MKVYQSRSQLIRTSVSGTRKSQLTYDKLPVSQEKIQQYKNQLKKSVYTPFQPSRINSTRKQKQISKQKNISSVKMYNATREQTFNGGTKTAQTIKPSSQKFRSICKSAILKQQNKESLKRPSTQFYKNRYLAMNERYKVYSPLEVINTKIAAQNNSLTTMSKSLKQLPFSTRRYCKSQLSRKYLSNPYMNTTSNFLRKGRGIDRSTIVNILKSKFKQRITSSNTNYSNSRNNTLLYAAIKRQIPNQFKDIIGPEQMLRMSKIMTGINIKGIDMDYKIKKQIKNRLVRIKIKSIESNTDDNENLKSIKRW